MAAGKFLLLFSAAGWTIDSNKVFRFDPSIPPEGMTIASRTPRYMDNLPPHLGHWAAMGRSHQTFWRAFTWMQIPVGGSGDPDMPDGTIGIYFGPEPKNVVVRSRTQAQKEMAVLLSYFVVDLIVADKSCTSLSQECRDQTLQLKHGVSALLEHCDCELKPTWQQRWNSIGDSSDATLDTAAISQKRKELLGKLIAALDKGRA